MVFKKEKTYVFKRWKTEREEPERESPEAEIKEEKERREVIDQLKELEVDAEDAGM